ncbi:MAG: YceI family protein [Chromatiaceae bacterium]|jgi:polyisoprenoid-binding protein YceI|nr:YceI family protein [Chromatiaceae bacterium]
MIKPILAATLATALLLPGLATAVEKYVIDTEGAHAFVQFRVKHLGYSWLYGRFNEFSGTFTYDEDDPSSSRVEVLINTASIDSNHAERDKHLRNEDFLDVKTYPEARFKSTSYKETGINKAVLTGDLTLRGITRPITIQVQKIGNGPDPWGGYRRGFEGTTTIALRDFGIDFNLGPAARDVELTLSVEGIRQ